MSERVVISAPGIFDLPEDVYHSDPAPEPSLSNSVAVLIDQQSPLHARQAHPRLNPRYVPPEPTADMDFGSAFHSMLLGKGSRVVPVNASDWRPKDAQRRRDEIRYERGIPLLTERHEQACDMVSAVRAQLAQHGEGYMAFTDGKPEQVAMWREGNVWCRLMADWLPDADGRYIDDLKTTGGSAHPRQWIRNHLFAMGYDMQAAFYLRGLRALGRKPAGFRFVVVENKPPYALSVVTLNPEAMAAAERKVERALGIWRQCMTTGVWPGYDTRTAWAELLPWDAARLEERAIMENAA